MSSIVSVTEVASTLTGTSIDNVSNSASTDIEALAAQKKQIEA